MGLDASIYKRPKNNSREVQYWRKNWVMNNWMNPKNLIDKTIKLEDMERLLNEIPTMKKEGYDGSERWTEETWELFELQIECIIKDMKANESYEYYYHAWW